VLVYVPAKSKFEKWLKHFGFHPPLDPTSEEEN
jgi:hypothetical protein